jgi:hypothetical protein
MKLFYATCPVCKRDIMQPFDPQAGPTVIVHHHGRRRSRAARLIVHPAERRVIEVPPDVSLEDALARELLGVA